ncbi:protein BREVIS RADIX-like [Gastrolobium bilobum]|uniref:protein BREVIS RADIX-like n=1 Tax=Gastrolobium bilobum TaxID=150636 RepID=UPI002AAFC9AB|nr:protein BREVIS RADIX-like [Gastrolobium bilobum]
MFACFVVVQDKISFLEKMFLFMNLCAKPTPVDGDEDDRGNGTPNTKEAVKGLASQTLNQRVFITPARSDDNENSGESEQDIPMASMLNTDSTPGNFHAPAGNMGYFHGGISRANNPTDNDMDAEWVEQDDPGVSITVKRSANGTRQIRRIKFK